MKKCIVFILLWHHNSNKKKLAYKTRQSKTWCVGDVESGWHKSEGQTETYSLAHPIPYANSVSFIYPSTLSSTYLRLHLPPSFFFIFVCSFSSLKLFSQLLNWRCYFQFTFCQTLSHSWGSMVWRKCLLNLTPLHIRRDAKMASKTLFFLVSFFTPPFLEMELTVKKKTRMQKARYQFLNVRHYQDHVIYAVAFMG